MRCKQQGYLSIIAIVLIFLVSAIGTVVVHSYTSELQSNAVTTLSEQALFLANAGLERASHHLLSSTATTPLSCNNSSANPVTGNANLTNAALGTNISGVFTVVNSNPNGTPYAQINATLSNSATASANTLTVNSTTGYAAQGWLMIDNEIVSYDAKTSTTFTAVTRARVGTKAAAHASGAKVLQMQCSLRSSGAVYDFTNPLALRRVESDILQISQSGWAVGQKTGSQARVVRWNIPTANTWNYSSTSSAPEELKSVAMLNHLDGWAVGHDIAAPRRFNIVRWNPSTETWDVSTGLPSVTTQYIRDLRSVSVVSSNDAWAVGQRANGTGDDRVYTILRWNGSSWCLLGPGSSPACSSVSFPSHTGPGRDLNGVHVIDTNNDGVSDFGFAVGQNGYILRYNGTSWERINEGGNDLLAVFVVSTQEAWAVGKAGTISRWNGTSWSVGVVYPGISGTPEWRGIYMLDTNGDGFADDGWVVGTSGNAARYTPATLWQSNNIAGVTNVNGVAMFATNDVWAAAYDGKLARWNGSSWTVFTPAASSNQDLRGISLIQGYQATSGSWHETFS